MTYQSKLEKLEQQKAAFQKSSPARERITALFDEGTFVELDAFVSCGNEGVGVITGYGSIEGDVVYAFSQDVTTLGGAVSRAHADKIAKVYDLAVKNGAPVVAIFDSNGAKLTEGPEILASYGKIVSASANLSGVVPQVSVIAGSCVGLSAVMAAGSDIVVMSEEGSFCYGDAECDSSAEAALAAGAADLVCKDDKEAVLKARELISMLPLNNLSESPVWEGTAPAAPAALDDKADAETLFAAVCDEGSVLELKAGYAKHAATALASIGGSTAGVIYVNGKMGSRSNAKVADFVRFCDCFNLAVVTFVNVDGVCSCTKLEGAKAAAKLAHAYADATAPKITVYTGSAIGGAAVAFANADVRLAWPSAVISALAPETAVEFFWHDKLKGAEDVSKLRAELAAEYAETEASPYEAANASMVEDIVAPANTRSALISSLEMLASKRVSRLPKKHTN